MKLTSSFLRTELPIYAVTFTNMSHFVLTVGMSSLIRAFPGTRAGVLMYLLTITTIAGIAGGFVFSVLTKRFSKKDLLLAGLALGCVCASMYLFFPTKLPLLFVAGAGQGLTCGFISTAFPLLVNIHVEEGERNRVLGFGSGIMQFGRLITLLIGGFLASIRWNYIYFTYAFMLAAFILTAFLLPQDKPAGKERGAGERSGSGDKPGLAGLLKSPGVWQLIVITLLFGIIQFPSTSHVSLYIEGYGLGLPSVTGALTAASCALAGLTGFFFAPIYRLSGTRTFWAAFLAVGAGFICAGLTVSLPSVLLGLALCTVSMSVVVPYAILCAGKVSDEDTAPVVLAMIPALLNLGSFLSPEIVNFLSGAFSDGGPAGAYLCSGLCSVMIAAVVFIMRRRLTCQPG